jgi:hypothetical protein
MLSCTGETSFALSSKPNSAPDSHTCSPCQNELDRKPTDTPSLSRSLQRLSFWHFRQIRSSGCITGRSRAIGEPTRNLNRFFTRRRGGPNQRRGEKKCNVEWRSDADGSEGALLRMPEASPRLSGGWSAAKLRLNHRTPPPHSWRTPAGCQRSKHRSVIAVLLALQVLAPDDQGPLRSERSEANVSRGCRGE